MRQICVGLLLVAISMVMIACGPHTANISGPVPILLYNGPGTSPNDVEAIERIMNGHGLRYDTANSLQLNAMTESHLRQYRLLVMPGGNFIQIGRDLTDGTTGNIRHAVQQGLNYLGICAGAILAGNPGTDGLNLAKDAQFKFYAIVDRGIHKAAVPIAVAGGPTLEQYWEDGPQMSGWGLVVGKYPDGTPAISEGNCGNGWVILCGVHPEAPALWRRGLTFNTSAEDDNAFALTLFNAALKGTSLPHY